MRSINYAFLGPEEQAGRFAKKGTASDITIFNAKSGDAHLNIVTPTRFPDKVMSLLMSLDMSDEIILQPAAIDRSLGEMVVAAELLGKTKGFVRAPATGSLADLQALLAKTALKDLTPVEESDAVFRERLYERAIAQPSNGNLVLSVDHSFPVKGVGTVVLGVVRRGEAKSHQQLQIFPSEKKLDVRSIQIHDVDHSSAGPRSRVGLAVKGVDPQDVSRGSVLALPGQVAVFQKGTTVAGTLDLHAFSKWQPRAGAVLHLFHVLQDVVARVEQLDVQGKSAKVTLKIEGDLAHVQEWPIVVVDVDNKSQRLVGRFTPA